MRVPKGAIRKIFHCYYSRKVKEMEVKGYKVFEPDWKCRDFQYAVGETFEEDVNPVCCNRGFHFCKQLKDCFNYYPFNPENKVAEVIALGDVDDGSENDKCCTNKIQIVKEISWEEVLRLVNMGKGNAGLCNSGNRNSGDWNSGDWNSGDWNSGDWNSGDWNSGNRNSGDCNSGNRNSGNRNSGDCNSGNRNSGDCNSGNRNSGDCNSGDWNKTNFSSGCFNTEEQKMLMFNKPSDWTYRDWLNSDARYILNQIPKDVVEWIWSSDMTDEEKKAHPEHETTGGYLKILDEKDCGQIWWDGLCDRYRRIIKALPNFDAEIFETITGIKIND